MTSAFSWQNSISLCPASFCTPRPNLPVTPGISWFPTFAFQSLIMKRTSLWVLVLEGLGGLHRTIQFQLLQHYWSGHILGLPWYWMVCLENEQRSFCRFWDCIQVLHFREKALAPHSSALAWKIPWAEEPGWLQSMGSWRVGDDWVTSLSLLTLCIGEGNGTPLQCSCLENPKDGRAWWAAIYGVSQSRTRLKRLSSSNCILDTFVDYDGYSISSKGILGHRSRYNNHLS